MYISLLYLSIINLSTYYIILAAIPIMLDNNVINLKTILKQIRSKIYEIPHISNYIMLQII